MTNQCNHNTVPPDKKTKAAAFAALDDLPPDLFREICFAARLWDASVVRELYLKRKQFTGEREAIDWMTVSIKTLDEDDLRGFANGFYRRYRLPLPHVGAEATILRFVPVSPPKRIRLRHGLPLRSRAAWKATERLMPQEDPRSGDYPTSREVEHRFASLDFLPPESVPAAA